MTSNGSTNGDAPPSFEETLRRDSIIATNTEVERGSSGDIGRASPLESRAQGARRSADDEEEELPNYDQDNPGDDVAPDYQERHNLAPVVAYNMYQINKKLQVLTPSTNASFDRPRYRITHRSGPSMFSKKKSDMVLTRLPTGTAAAAESSPGKEVSFMNFDKSGQIPWMPRAKVEVVIAGDGGVKEETRSFDMSAPSFADWNVSIDGQAYSWQITTQPTALSFVEASSNSVVARFTYSASGTDATRGAEMGVIDIFGGNRSDDVERIEFILSTAQIPINHWKNMGRHYHNNTTPTNQMLLNHFSIGSSMFWNAM